MNAKGNPMEDLQYAGFWIRAIAAIIDSILGYLMVWCLWLLLGESLNRGVLEFLLLWVAPAVVTVLFWRFFQATPGKILTSLKIVGSGDNEGLTWKSMAIRYLSYFISLIPLCLGYVWIGIDSRKQGWHDKIAKTYVVKDPLIRKSKAWKITLAAVILSPFIFAFLLGIGSVQFMKEYREAEQIGGVFGANHHKEECLNETFSKYQDDTGPIAHLFNLGFLSGCLNSCENVTGFCDSVPSSENEAETDKWSKAKCENGSLNPIYCYGIYYIVRKHCDEQR